MRRLRRERPFVVGFVLSAALAAALAGVMASLENSLWSVGVSLETPQELLLLSREVGVGAPALLSGPDAEAIELAGISRGVAVARSVRAALSGNVSVVSRGELVNRGYFDVLGVRGLVGRPFAAADGSPNRTLVLRQSLAAQLFGSSRAALNQYLKVGGLPFVVVGIAPDDFGGIWAPASGEFKFWILLDDVRSSWPPGNDQPPLDNPDYGVFAAVARVPTAGQAHFLTQLTVLSDRLEAAYPTPPGWPVRRFSARRIIDILVSPNAEPWVRPILTVVNRTTTTLVIVLVMTFGLLFSRHLSGLRAEFNVLHHIGATRFAYVRIAGTTLVSSLAASMALSLFAVPATLNLIQRQFGSRAMFVSRLHVSPLFYLITVLVLLVAGVIAALSRLAPMNPGRAIDTTIGLHSRIVRTAAAMICMVISVGLIAISLTMGTQLDQVPRLRADLATGAITVISMNPSLVPADATAVDLHSMLNAVGTHSGATVAWADSLGPLAPAVGPSVYRQASLTAEGPTSLQLQFIGVAGDFRDVMHVNVLEGEWFTAADFFSASPTRLVVTRQTERAWWPGGSAIGQHVWVRSGDLSRGQFARGDQEYVVAGVISDWYTLSDLAWRNVHPVLVPVVDRPLRSGYLIAHLSYGVNHSSVPPEMALRALVPSLPIIRSSTLAALESDELGIFMYVRLLFLILASWSIVVTLSGLFTWITDDIRRRKRELGIRLAVGATPLRLLRTLAPDLAVGFILASVASVSGAYAGGSWLSTFLRATLLGWPAEPVKTGLTVAAIWLALISFFGVTAMWATTRLVKLDPSEIIREGLQLR